MKLRIKTVIIFGGTVLLFVLLLFLANDYLFLRGYENLELKEFDKVKKTVIDKIENENFLLSQVTKSLSTDKNLIPEFSKKGLVSEELSQKFDYAFIINQNFESSIIFYSPSKSIISLDELKEKYSIQKLIEAGNGKINLGNTLYVFGINKISDTESYLILLKEIFPQLLSDMMNENSFQFTYTQIQDNPNKTIQSVLKSLQNGKVFEFIPVNDEIASIYYLINDFTHKPIFVAQIGMDRTTYKLGKAHAKNIFLLISLLSLFAIALMLIIVEMLILGRIEKLKLQVGNAAENDDDTTFIGDGGNDELSLLAEQIETTMRTKRFYYKSLMESELLYKSIFEFSADGYIILSKEKFPVYCNKKFTEIFGYSYEEIENKNIYNLIGGKLNPENRLIKENRKRKDGEEITVDIISTKLTIKHKPVILERYTDVTEITRLEEEAKRQQEKLQQTDKLASLGLLVSGVAHEINNPNTFISLNIPYIEKYITEIYPIIDEHANKNPDFKIGNIDYKIFKEDLKDLLIDLKEGSKRITAIVNELKSFAKPDADSENSIFNINEIINSALRLLSSQIRSKNCNVIFQIEKEYKINGNKQKFGQVIINCLTNALDAVEDDKGEILISFIEDINKLTCLIKDNGSGVEPSIMKHIFDPFYTTKGKQGGTGLGLSVAKSIIESMGYSISIESEIGKGTIVILTLNGEFN